MPFFAMLVQISVTTVDNSPSLETSHASNKILILTQVSRRMLNTDSLVCLFFVIVPRQNIPLENFYTKLRGDLH